MSAAFTNGAHLVLPKFRRSPLQSDLRLEEKINFEQGRRHAVALISWVALGLIGCPQSSEPLASQPQSQPQVDESMPVAEAAPSVAPEVAAAREANRESLRKDAVAQLRASADFLARVPSYRFTADFHFDVLQKNGQMLEFGETRIATVRRPDRLRLDIIRRGGENATLFFDGQNLSVDLPDHEAFVRVEKPGTTDAILDYMSDDLNMPTPLEQFLSSNFAADVADRIETAYFVDVERFGDRWCEHLAYRLPEVDFQLWIEEGDRPLPCRLVITYRQAPGDPVFAAQFHDWDLTAETPDALFAYAPPEGAEHLAVQTVARSIRDSREGQ